jgi:hypothetical protein
MVLPTVLQDKMVAVHMVQDQAPTLETTTATAMATAPVAAMAVLAITSLVAHFQAQPAIQAVPKTRSASLETVSPSQIPCPVGPHPIVSPVSSVVSLRSALQALPVSMIDVSESMDLPAVATLSALVDMPVLKMIVFFLETLQIAAVRLAPATRSVWVTPVYQTQDWPGVRTLIALMTKHVETGPVFLLKMLVLLLVVLLLVVLKDLAEDLATVVTVLRLETTTVAVPPLALMETHQNKPHQQPINPTRQVDQKGTVDVLVLVRTMVGETVIMTAL